MSIPKPITDPAVIDGYLTDASNTRGHADALVRPDSTEAVASIVAHCQSEGIPLTITAQRTSTTGGPVPQGGWLLSMERLDHVFAPDDVQGGVILGAHQDELERIGRFFPPDPTSRHECSIGAAIACNASGSRTFRYGPTRPWIRSAEVVLPTGEIVQANRQTPIPADWPRTDWVEPAVKTAAGFYPTDNLLDLMIGQEGTLGIVTRAQLVLIDSPETVLALVAFFPDDATCLDFVEKARAGATRPGRDGTVGALDPRAIEYFDRQALDLARSRVPDIPAAAHAALFIEIEHQGEAPLEAWWEALLEMGALADDTIVADDESGTKRLHAVRHAIPAAVNEQVVTNGMPKVGTDFAVPDGALAEMMAAYHGVTLPHVLFGHIGDNHLHLNLLPTNPAELAQARLIYRNLAHKAVSLGGTVSAEHGIGKIKRELLADMVGARTMAGFSALKQHLDPAWILGRGTILEPPSA